MTDGRTRPAKVPDAKECIGLLVSSGCDEDVIEHCKAVSALAVRIARRCGADEALVEAGALLHDIGRCSTHGLDHAVEGARIASSLKLHPALVKIIERHIGAGISKEEAVRSGLPPKDYTPESLEEKIVAHADNLFAGRRRTPVRDAVSSLVRNGMDGPAAKVLALHRDLSKACKVDVDDIR